MKVSVFTPSRERPECLASCRKWIAQQTYPIHEHIVSEGGTLVENLMDGLPKVTGDIIVIAEDDDYYPPDWVETCVSAFSLGALAYGDIRSHYYHLGLRRYRLFKHSGRASLSTTALRTSLVGMLLDACTSEKMIDIRFWRELTDQHVPRAFRDSATAKVVGLKGRPGLRGLGFGHIDRCYLAHASDRDSENYKILRSLVGDEALIDLGVAPSSQTQTPDQSAC